MLVAAKLNYEAVNIFQLISLTRLVARAKLVKQRAAEASRRIMVGCRSNWREITGQRIIAGDLWHPIPSDHGVAVILRVWIEIVGRKLRWEVGVGILARIVRSWEGRREGLYRGPSLYL
jgi:hypothetical protein